MKRIKCKYTQLKRNYISSRCRGRSIRAVNPIQMSLLKLFCGSAKADIIYPSKYDDANDLSLDKWLSKNIGYNHFVNTIIC